MDRATKTAILLGMSFLLGCGELGTGIFVVSHADAGFADGLGLDGARHDGRLGDDRIADDHAAFDRAAGDAIFEDAIAGDANDRDRTLRDAVVDDRRASDNGVDDTMVCDTAVHDATTRDSTVRDAAAPDATTGDALVADTRPFDVGAQTDRGAAGDAHSSPFGVNVPPSGAYESDFQAMELLGRTGYTWNRISLLWASVQQQTSDLASRTFRWGWASSHVDPFIARQPADVTNVMILSYNVEPNGSALQLCYNPPDLTPRVFEPGLGRTISYWEEYVYQMVVRYRARIRYWEVWNEPDWVTWTAACPLATDPNSNPLEPEKYANLLIATAQVIRQVDPDALVVLGGIADYRDQMAGFANPDDLQPYTKSYLTALHTQGAFSAFDVFNIHPYRAAPTDAHPDSLQTYAHNLISFLKTLDPGFAKPIFFTEISFNPGDVTTPNLEHVARVLDRTYQLPAAVPEVQSIFWFMAFEGSLTTVFHGSSLLLCERSTGLETDFCGPFPANSVLLTPAYEVFRQHSLAQLAGSARTEREKGNVLGNGDLEYASTLFWYEEHGGGAGSAAPQILSDGSGGHVMRVTCSDVTTCTGAGKYSSVVQYVPVPDALVGSTLALSLRARAAQASTTLGVVAWAWGGSTWTVVGGNDNFSVGSSFATHSFVTAPVPAGTTLLQLALYVRDPGSVDVDDVSVRPTP
ncbi:MAG: hypothetical protein JXR83_15670 [Deltaproteobacteria bacterium]|nr:hypothetical protein [Deltaproteobacteria bacterium]